MALRDHTTPSPAAVQGVVWDFGGVLIQWDPFPAVAAAVGADAAGRFFSEVDFAAWNHAQDAGRSWADALAVLEREHPDQLAAGQGYVRHFADSLVGEVPGTHALVRELADAGVRQFGLTNWSHETFPHAPKLFDTLSLLEQIVVSGTEQTAKPDAAIFHVLAERAGLPLDSLAFVDDSPANVAAARSLGMRAMHFTDADTLRSDLASLALPV